MRPKTFWVAVAGLTLLLFFTVNFVWPDDDFRIRTIDGDGRGYYDYLPTLLLYHTVDFKKTFEFEKANHPPGYLGHNFHKVNGVYINKFTVGTSLMMLPFFLVAHVLSPLLGLPADGYSLLYQYEIALAALFWLWVGLFFLWRLLKSYRISDNIGFGIMLFLITGTNLLHYALVDVAFSHVYSFAAIAAFLYSVRRLLTGFTLARLATAAFLFGWVVLIRPVNAMVLLAIPFLSFKPEVFKQLLIFTVSPVKNLVTALAMFALGIMPQLVINYLQTGNPVVYGYKGEGFYFLNPHITGFLFSYKKGWFVYTPLMLLLIPAVLSLYKRSLYVFITFGIFLLLLLYLFSSWWNWYYGDGFGMRPMVDYYALFALVIALWITKLKPVIRKWILVVSVLLAALNIVQTYQYFKGIIHVDSMNKQAYRYLFLKTSDKYRNVVAPADEFFYGKLSEKPLLISTNDFEGSTERWSKAGNIAVSKFRQEDHCLKMDDKTAFSSSFQFTADEQMADKRLYLIIKSEVLEPVENAALKALFVVDVHNDKGELKFYKAFPVKALPDTLTNKWTAAHKGVVLPLLNYGDRVKCYIWNKEKTRFFIDNMEVVLYEIY